MCRLYFAIITWTRWHYTKSWEFMSFLKHQPMTWTLTEAGIPHHCINNDPPDCLSLIITCTMSDSRLYSFFISTKNTVLRFIPPPHHKSWPHPGRHVSLITPHPAPQQCTSPAITSAAHIQQSHTQTLALDTSTVQNIFPAITPNISALACEEPPHQKVSWSQVKTI